MNSMYRREDSESHKISVIFEGNKKRIEKDGKKIQDRKELINTIPCILFCHDDMRFATGEPEARRFFIDQSLSLYDSAYLDDIRSYKKILKSRNMILKNHEYEMLDVYDQQLAQVGLIVQDKRKKAIFQFNQIFGKLFEQITGIDGVSISYHPSWKAREFHEEGNSLEKLENVESAKNFFPASQDNPSLQDVSVLLKMQRERDKVMETTLSGPHRDRIDFVKSRQLFVPTASTGQRRLISLILRVSQSVYYTRVTGLKPVLLMDDVLLELDPDKRAKLTALLPDYEQLFCTFLPGEPYERYMHETTRVYKINGGEWHE